MDIHHGYEPWKSAPTSVTKTTFGHADWDAAKSQGKSAKEIADWARANQQIMSQGPKNIPGGGGLWDQIMAAEQAARGGGRPSYAYTQSNQFIHDTYDPLLGYERSDSPGDNPYIYDLTPEQIEYMNNYSPLSAEDLAYGDGDRSEAAARSLLNNYIFRINDEVRDKDELELKVGTITPQDTDLIKRGDELFGPYDQYNSDRYY